MVCLRFCAPCGAKRVKEVRHQLEKLFKRKKYKGNECAICCQKFKTLPHRAANKLLSSYRKHGNALSEVTSSEEKVQSDEEPNDIKIGKADGKVNQKLEVSKSEVRSRVCQLQSTDGPVEDVVKSALDSRELNSRKSSDFDKDAARELNSSKDSSTDCQLKLKCTDESGEKKTNLPENSASSSSEMKSMKVKPADQPVKVKSDIDSEELAFDSQDVDSHEDGNDDSDTDEEFTPSKARKNRRQHVEVKSTNESTGKSDLDFYKSSLDPEVLDMLAETDSTKQPFKCKLCSKQFAYVKSFLNHAATHPGVEPIEKPFKCKVCGVNFPRIAYIISHDRMHSMDRPFKCNYPPCTAAFKDKNTLAHHEQRRHMQSTVRYKCELCPKEYKYKDELKVHKKKHSGAKPFMCGSCGKLFTDKSYLAIHELQHIKDKPFKCKFCDKSYCQEVLLEYHEMDHTGVRPYVCEVCGRGFKSKFHLSSHAATHSNDKPFKCDRCDYRTKWEKNLRQHEGVHATEKCFECPKCGKLFNRKHALSKHEKRFLNRDCGDIGGKKAKISEEVGAESRKVEGEDQMNEEGASYQNRTLQSEECIAVEIATETVTTQLQGNNGSWVNVSME